MTDIFFSYARRDLKLVEALVAALEARDWSVWWDPDVHGGDSWSDVIEAELKQAKCVIVAWSKQSATSEWVKEEARVAYKFRKLVPVLLEPIDPPFGFGGVQTVDLSGWNGNREAPEFLRLCAAVQRKLDSPASSLPPVSKPPEKEPAPPSGDEEGPSGELKEPKEPAKSDDKAPVGAPAEPPREPERRRRTALMLVLLLVAAIPIGAGTIWFQNRAPGAGYTVFLHTKYPAPRVEFLRQSLEAAGYKVSALDSDADNDSGRVAPRSGVDYAAADPDSKHRTAAANAAQIANEVLGTSIKPRPQSAMSSEKLGIWLPYKGDYNVSIRFAGAFDRDEHIVPFAKKLKTEGWNVTPPKPSGGNDREEKAAGLHQVRYAVPDDEPFARLLAADVAKTGINSLALDLVKTTTGISDERLTGGSLQVVISPSGPRKPPQ